MIPIIDPDDASNLADVLNGLLPGKCHCCDIDARRLVDYTIWAAVQDGLLTRPTTGQETP